MLGSIKVLMVPFKEPVNEDYCSVLLAVSTAVDSGEDLDDAVVVEARTAAPAPLNIRTSMRCQNRTDTSSDSA